MPAVTKDPKDWTLDVRTNDGTRIKAWVTKWFGPTTSPYKNGGLTV